MSVQNNSLPAFDKKDFSTAEICSHAEKTTGFNSIIGAQKISGLWRIYPRDKGGRQKLLIQGMTVRGVQVTVKDKNPYLVRSLDGKEEETPTTKVIVGNVPISFSDQEINFESPCKNWAAHYDQNSSLREIVMRKVN